jgi:hypothetical protein
MKLNTNKDFMKRNISGDFPLTRNASGGYEFNEFDGSFYNANGILDKTFTFMQNEVSVLVPALGATTGLIGYFASKKYGITGKKQVALIAGMTALGAIIGLVIRKPIKLSGTAKMPETTETKTEIKMVNAEKPPVMPSEEVTSTDIMQKSDKENFSGDFFQRQ